MRVLWIVNQLLPDAAAEFEIPTGRSGTWMIDLARQLAHCEGISLGVACVAGDRYRDAFVKGIRYFAIPGDGQTMLFYHKSLASYWETIEESFRPDVVHVHGTEYSHALPYLRRYPDKPVLVTVQGVLEMVARNARGGLSLPQALRYRTPREYLKLNGMIERQLLQRWNVRYEREIIQRASHATGRTDWDRYYIQRVNPEVEYHRCYYNLRDEFYGSRNWSVGGVHPCSVFASTAAQHPMKGGHMALKILSVLRERHPSATMTFLSQKRDADGLPAVTNGYVKYIRRLIHELDLRDSVRFIGGLDAPGIIEVMLASNAVLIPSACENASATLREAMHLGVPCVAAYRGGMAELIQDGESGFFYDYHDEVYGAGRLSEILRDPGLAARLSGGARAAVAGWHDRVKNVSDYIDVYRQML
jgi:glycosyltransferase involved in cell wall biosynthesis